ncbi:hypothetical protein MTO96_019392 [Rhipicephalus appendiculatus]
MGTPEWRHSACELIRYFDYPCEISHVTTEDGYVIEVDRVPRGRQDNATAPSQQNGTLRYPVLFVPPLAGASDIWFVNYPSQSPGTCLTSVEEGSSMKLAAMTFPLESITCSTPPVRDKLTLVSLSQGVVDILVFLSTRPEYNDKVDLVVAYGPVANVSNMGPPLSLLIPFTPLLATLAYPFSMAGYLGATEGFSEFLAKLCEIFNGEACSLVVTITAFSSPYQLNETRVPVYIGHYPVGTTLQNFKHYYQMYRAKDFVMYDYGAKENKKRYGQADAPAYPLERITAPWVIFSSEGDVVADPRDVEDLVARLGPRVILHRVVPQKTFRHDDFSLGYRASDFLHNVAIDVIKQHFDESA